MSSRSADAGSMVKRVSCEWIVLGSGALPCASGHQKKTLLSLSPRSRTMLADASSYALAVWPGKEFL